MLRNERELPDRRGAILIVVLAISSLFAIVGITFVLVAGQNAEKQRILRDARADENGPAIVDDGTEHVRPLSLARSSTMSRTMRTGMQNSLRGHSLVAPCMADTSRYRTVHVQRGTTVAWNGVGNFSDRRPPPRGVDRKFLLNYRQFPGIPQVYDPGIRRRAPRDGHPGSGAGSIYIPKNAPYTYPDINNILPGVDLPRDGRDAGAVVLPPGRVRPARPGTLQPRSQQQLDERDGQVPDPSAAAAEHPQFPYPPRTLTAP